VKWMAERKLYVNFIIGIDFVSSIRTICVILLSRARWNNTPKDVVIVHGFPRGRKTPNASPWILKVETYCRMAKFVMK